MVSARARVGLGAAVSAALAVTLLPVLSVPASAVTASDPAVSTSTVTEAAVTSSSLTTSTLASVQTTVTAVPVATYALPTSRTGYVTLSAAALDDPVVRGRAVRDTAKRFAGVPYVAGGTSPSYGFDCSGYTRYVYSRLKISIPRVSRDQYAAATPIARSSAVPGDLVFFYSSSGRIYHVSIYAGGGYIWHSPYPGQRVKLEKIWTSRWKVARVQA